MAQIPVLSIKLFILKKLHISEENKQFATQPAYSQGTFMVEPKVFFVGERKRGP
jgi:hypothetical protein